MGRMGGQEVGAGEGQLDGAEWGRRRGAAAGRGRQMVPLWDSAGLDAEAAKGNRTSAIGFQISDQA